MLQTQVDFWRLQEQKRSNRAQEALKDRELDYQAQNARTNAINAETNRGQLSVAHRQADTAQMQAETAAVNALTNQYSAQAAHKQADASSQQAATALQRLDLDKTIAAMNYDVGLRQAAAAQTQALVASSRVDSEIAKNQASANYTQKQADTHYWVAGAEAAKDASFAVSNVVNMIPNVAKGVGSLLSEIKYRLR